MGMFLILILYLSSLKSTQAPKKNIRKSNSELTEAEKVKQKERWELHADDLTDEQIDEMTKEEFDDRISFDTYLYDRMYCCGTTIGSDEEPDLEQIQECDRILPFIKTPESMKRADKLPEYKGLLENKDDDIEFDCEQPKNNTKKKDNRQPLEDIIYNMDSRDAQSCVIL